MAPGNRKKGSSRQSKNSRRNYRNSQQKLDYRSKLVRLHNASETATNHPNSKQSVNDNGRDNDHTAGRYLASIKHHRELVISIVICLTLGAYLVLPSKEHGTLPLTFRIDRTELSGFPVEISNVQSCGCWSGQRKQATKKFKFKITNNSPRTISLIDSEESNIRLILAYPRNFSPRLTLPSSTDDNDYAQLANPPDTSVYIAHSWREVRPSRIEDSQKLFGVPDNFEVWAIPAAPNYVAEQTGDEYGHATIVDQAELLPGESYFSEKLGHGSWVFNVPLPKPMATLFSPGGFEFVPDRSFVNKYVRIVGIAALNTSESDGVSLLGFAPAPPDSSLASPLSL